MLSNNDISLNSLSSIITEIKHDEEQSVIRFGFDEFKYELAKVEYDNKTKYESVMRINEWIESVPYHTFPKTKYKWINTIMAQPDLRNIAVNYKITEIVTNVYLKDHIPIYILNFYNSIYNSPHIDKNALLKEKSILCKLNAIQVFDNLVELELVTVKGRRVYINRFKLERKVLSLSPSPRKRMIDTIESDDDDSDDSDSVITYKKQRIS